LPRRRRHVLGVGVFWNLSVVNDGEKEMTRNPVKCKSLASSSKISQPVKPKPIGQGWFSPQTPPDKHAEVDITREGYAMTVRGSYHGAGSWADENNRHIDSAFILAWRPIPKPWRPVQGKGTKA
jgi:hypothetical protein